MASWQRIAERAEAEVIRLNGILNKHSIIWSVEDFEHQAIEREKRLIKNDVSIKYDRTKFLKALEKMIEKHDACIGICWDTIDCYLDEYCEI